MRKKYAIYGLLILIIVLMLIQKNLNAKSNIDKKNNQCYLKNMQIKNSILVYGKIFPYQETEIISLFSGILTKLHYKIGDRINKDVDLFEFESNKQIKNIKSPEKGVLTSINYLVGSKVICSPIEVPTLATISNFDSLLFKTYIEEKYLQYIKIGDNVELEINNLNDLKVDSKINMISIKPVLLENEYLYPIECIIKNQPKLTRKFIYGYSAKGEIILQLKKNTFAIDEKYIFYHGNNSYVNILNSNGEKIHKKVKLGISDGINIEIISGVSKSDLITL
jgi:hypothetical protein